MKYFVTLSVFAKLLCPLTAFAEPLDIKLATQKKLLSNKED